MQKVNSIMQHIRNNPLPWVVQIIGSFLFVGNMYLASQLFPLVRSLDLLTARVNAVEELLDDRAPIVERFLQLEQRDVFLVQDINELKQDMKRLLQIHGVRE